MVQDKSFLLKLVKCACTYVERNKLHFYEMNMNYDLQEINRNAEELITEEEREKKRIEKRKAKKKVPSECDKN